MCELTREESEAQGLIKALDNLRKQKNSNPGEKGGRVADSG